MRKAFVQALLKHVASTGSVFLTGDLGFMALEPLRDAMGARFVNAGIAEQNMMSVAAGLARTGLSVWVYSIAPFCYARPFEQIRNDICMHKLPVHLVGNGGGYAYGVMGATHHAIEDYGALLTLSGMRAYIPAFDGDLDTVVRRMERDLQHPSYLRLGRSELPGGPEPAYSPWRRLLSGGGPVIATVGPLGGAILGLCADLSEAVRPEIWVVTELPFEPEGPPREFLTTLRKSPALWVVEEHVAQGSLGRMLASSILAESIHIPEFRHFHAKGYPSGRYGSQTFHRTESGIDAGSILEAILTRERALQRR